MENEFKRILSVFLGGVIVLMSVEFIWLIAADNKLTIIRLIILLITLTAGLTLVKVGLRSS